MSSIMFGKQKTSSLQCSFISNQQPNVCIGKILVGIYNRLNHLAGLIDQYGADAILFVDPS